MTINTIKKIVKELSFWSVPSPAISTNPKKKGINTICIRNFRVYTMKESTLNLHIQWRRTLTINFHKIYAKKKLGDHVTVSQINAKYKQNASRIKYHICCIKEITWKIFILKGWNIYMI
jgi:hypothetical protein